MQLYQGTYHVGDSLTGSWQAGYGTSQVPYDSGTGLCWLGMALPKYPVTVGQGSAGAPTAKLIVIDG